MNRQLSPKDLALVIGVSESSLKRWVDEGRLVAIRTAGGHRRIALHEAVRFIRDTNQTLSRPELLGLRDLSDGPLTAITTGAGDTALLKALESGNAEQARGLIMAQYLASRSFAAVCDGPLSFAMNRIGELWHSSDSGIAIEHRATQIVQDSLHHIRATLPPVPDDAPPAIGSTGPSDMHSLPTLMAATTLLETGFRDINLGSYLPFDALLGAARDVKAKIVWLAISINDDHEAIVPALKKLADGVAALGATLVIGGRGIYARSLPPLPATNIVGTMGELASLARGLKANGFRPILSDRVPAPAEPAHAVGSNGFRGMKAKPKR